MFLECKLGKFANTISDGSWWNLSGVVLLCRGSSKRKGKIIVFVVCSLACFSTPSHFRWNLFFIATIKSSKCSQTNAPCQSESKQKKGLTMCFCVPSLEFLVKLHKILPGSVKAIDEEKG